MTFRPGDLPAWEGKPFRGLRVGNRVRYLAYAGRGLNGPEYREATGTVRIVNVDSVVVTSKRNGMPTVVNAANIL